MAPLIPALRRELPKHHHEYAAIGTYVRNNTDSQLMMVYTVL